VLKLLTGLFLACVLGLNGCGGKPKDQGGVSAKPAKPKQAAVQLQQAFAGALPDVKNQASIAAEALLASDYENAVISLQIIQEHSGLTLEQGMAVHNSMVSLEASLIGAMNTGDLKATRAYGLLKRAKRR
jgi:hypothetical protein